MLSILNQTMMLVASVLLGYGLLQFAMLIFKAPSVDTSKTLKSINKKSKLSNASKSEFSDNAAELLSRFIPMNEFKRKRLEADLKSAQVAETPEVYQAKAVIEFLKYSVLAIPFLFFFPLLSPLMLILAAMKFIQKKNRVKDRIEEKRKQINLDLPRFVNTIVYELPITHDPLVIMEKHKDSFSPMFTHELSVTIADMRSGNYEAALQRMEGRIGSSNLSEVVRGLIEMVKGNNTNIYWETLAFKFSEMQKQALRKEADKIPPRVHKLSLWILFTIMGVYIVVLGTVLVDGMKALF